MNNKKRSALWLMAAVMAGGLAARARDATAANCTGPMSTSWGAVASTQALCGASKRATSQGFNEGNIAQELRVNAITGLHAFAFGYDPFGAVMPNCFAFDASPGGTFGSDNSGCFLGRKHQPTSVF